MAQKDSMSVALGDVLRAAREKLGLSQEELAHNCGLHRTYVGAVERGEYNLTLISLRRITDALGITVLEAIKGMSVRMSDARRTSRVKPRQ